MRRIRLWSLVLLAVALVSFAAHQVEQSQKQDAKGPVIQMEETEIKVSVKDDAQALLSGVHATDEKDGDVTDTLMIESESGFIRENCRVITIAAFDRDDHVTKATREIVYEDYESPRFQLENPLRFPKNTDSIIQGMRVTDVLDGDLTDHIKISSDYKLDESEAGSYPMEFVVTNQAGDTVRLPATVEIYDPQEENQRPKLILSNYLVYATVGALPNFTEFLTEIQIGAQTYQRGEDGNYYETQPFQGASPTVISQNEILVEQPMDGNTPGVYEVVYKIETENKGTGSVPLIVIVE